MGEPECAWVCQCVAARTWRLASCDDGLGDADKRVPPRLTPYSRTRSPAYPSPTTLPTPPTPQQVRTRTNRSGGVQGGLSNGEDIVIRVAFKPTSTIGIKQNTVTRDGQETELRARGRHDPCVVPR